MSKKQDLKLPEFLIQATVNIGASTGTGFLCSPVFNNPCLFFVVSNAHVLKSFKEETSISLSHPPNDNYKLLRPFSDEVYPHPDGIDLACVVAYQDIHVGEPGSPDRFHLQPLTSDYFTEPQTSISSSSKLTFVGYPKDNSCSFEPLIQEEHLVCDLDLKDHHFAIKPSLGIGASGGPVFIERDGLFFVLGVVQGKNEALDVSFIIKRRYVSELLDHASECFKKQHGTTPFLKKKTINPK